MSPSRALPFVLSLVLVGSGCVIEQGPMLDPRDAGVDATADAPRPDAGFRCSPDAIGCFGNVRYRCGADGISRLDEVVCDEACDVTLGCVACVPGSRRCDGDVSLVCLDDGSGYGFGRDCGDWEVACGSDGYCDDACAEAEATRSYVGCEYWATPLANYYDIEDRGFDFRVVVANSGARPAEITITRGARLIERETVPPGAATDITLPWIDDVSFAFSDDPRTGSVATDGAYRVRSTEPVVVAQFNPFHYASASGNSYSNDASLLLPSHVLGTDYFGLSYLPLSFSAEPDITGLSPGYLALVGVAPESTEVAITLTTDLAADRGGRWAAASRGETVRFNLARGEVAQLVPAPPPRCDATRPGYLSDLGLCREAAFDLTGSHVVTSRPIAAFGGHVCAYAPYDVAACDHLETALAPTVTWGTRYATAPLSDPATGLPNLLRIVAAHDGTAITATPPIDGLDPTLVLDAGEHVEVMLRGPVAIEGSHPIEVAQILLGQNITDPPQTRGDPALTMLVPEEQFRVDYVFITPTSYTAVAGGQSWVLVSREPGAAIQIDGAPLVATWTRVGDRELATVPLAGGSHHAAATSRFGLIAFGLGSYTSYAYPAGLDLQIVPF